MISYDHSAESKDYGTIEDAIREVGKNAVCILASQWIVESPKSKAHVLEKIESSFGSTDGILVCRFRLSEAIGANLASKSKIVRSIDIASEHHRA